jgi:DNA phosphorothioation-dependent restriction protein DptH
MSSRVFESELVEAAAKCALTWALQNSSQKTLTLVSSVPRHHLSDLVREARKALSDEQQEGAGERGQHSILEVFEYCPGVPLAELSDHQVNEEKATDRRNEVSVLLFSPPSSPFPSIGSAFEERSFQNLIQVTAQSIYKAAGADDGLIGALGLEKWLAGEGGERSHSEGWALLVLMIARGLGGPAIGRELWRVGLIPDVGISEGVGEFSVRLARNREIVKCLGSISKGKRVLDRLAAAKVGVTPTIKKVVGVLDELNLANAAGLSGWCRALIMDREDEDQNWNAYSLTLDKWDLQADQGDLERLFVVPFRDQSGKVRPRTKLKQNPPNTHSESLYVEVGFNQSGDVAKPPSIVVEWETEPVQVKKVGKWRVSIVRPKNMRQADEEPLLVRAVRSDQRKCSLKLDISLEDLPEDFLGKSILVVVEIAALSADDEMVLLLKSGEEATAESDDFEIRLIDAPPAEPLSDVSVDDAVSPAAAVLEIATTISELSMSRAYVLQLERSVLEMRFFDPESTTAAPRAIRNVRIARKLLELQEQLLKNPRDYAFVQVVVNSDEPESNQFKMCECQGITEELAAARADYFDLVVQCSKTANQIPLVETLEWEPEVSAALDLYVQAYVRALDAAGPSEREQLLLLDTVQLRTVSATPVPETVIVLPTHPLRSVWLREYWKQLEAWSLNVLDFPQASRASLIDLSLVNRLALGNLPFLARVVSGTFNVYAEEIAFGYGLYISPGESDHESIMSATIGALGAVRSNALQASRLVALRRNFDNYVDRRRHPDALAVTALNAGDGSLLSVLLGRYFAEETDSADARSDFRMEITAYADRRYLRRPVAKLVELQARLRDVGRAGLSHLSPLIGLSIRPREMLATDQNSVHLSVVQGIAGGSVQRQQQVPMRVSYLGGLITGTHTSRNLETRRWHVVPTGSEASQASVTVLHKAILAAQGSTLSGLGDVGLSIELTPETATEIRALHERSDRVLILDRHAGLDWFIRSRSLGLGTSYILDYTPDFVEGLADRLIVTTQHPAEADRLIERVMREMGLDGGHRRTQVVENLNLVSGRLVMRLMTETPQAHETVGLAVVTAVLRNEGELNKSVIVPIDSHLEVFGGAVSGIEDVSRRCDILLVTFSEHSISIRCVEVKERKTLPISGQTRRRIQEQLDSTETILNRRYFEDSLERLDRELQLAHFSSILHHYIDRSRDHDLLAPELEDFYHKSADDLANLNCSISKEAFVVSVDSEPRSPEMIDDITVRYLTAADLSLTAFTTAKESSRRTLPVLPVDGIDQGDSEPSPETSSLGTERRTRFVDAPQNVADPEPRSSSKVDTKLEQPSDLNVKDQVASLEEVVSVDRLAKSDQLTTSGDGPKTVNPETVHLPDNPQIVTVEIGQDQTGKPVLWNLSTKGSPHALVIGITGQGKSVTTRHSIATFSEQGLPSLVIDVHGDMAASPPPGATVLDVREHGLGFSPFYLTGHSIADISESALEIAEVFSFVCGLGNIQLANVFKSIKLAYADNGWVNGMQGRRLPTIEEFADKLEQVEKGARGRNARENLLPLTDFGLFQESDKRFEPTGGGKGLVIDLHRHRHEKVITAAISLVLRKIYREMFTWPQDSTMKLAVVLDEAHRIAKDPTLPKLLKEGRKYGVACFVASQNISDFDDEVKNNVGTKIVFRTNFPESKDVAALVRGAEKVDLATQIEQLKVGEAFVSTADLSRARKCRMRARP